MAKKESKDYRDSIIDTLNQDERSLSWLSRKTGVPYGTLYSALVQKTCHVSGKNLEKVNNVLKSEFQRL